MSFLSRIFGPSGGREALLPLYRRIVEEGRAPFWYREGGVPDTLQGRFDMIAAVMALVLLRLEREESANADSVRLTEIFIDDMEGTVRQIGIGDLMVGKHVGKMMSALGGRLAAFRAVAAREREMEEAVRHNVFHDAPPSEDAPKVVAERLARFVVKLEAVPAATLLAGEVPSP